MRRGTTPTHIYKLPFDVSLVEEIRITYAQNNKTVLTKTMADCMLDGEYILLTLTQEETLKFNDYNPVQAQIRIQTTSGNVIASKIMAVKVRATLDEVIM